MLRLRRRPAQLRHGYADQLHRQRQQSLVRWWRPLQRIWPRPQTCSTTASSAATLKARSRRRLANYNGTINLTGCTISGNDANSFGGGLYSGRGNNTLIDCTISDNTALGREGGGLLFSGGTTTLTDCKILENTAAAGGGGVAGAASVGGSAILNLANCTITGNSAGGYGGGGVATYDYCTTTLTDCTISGNTSSTNGGGIWNAYLATTTLSYCNVSGNTAVSGGGIFNNVSTLNGDGGTLNVSTSSTIQSNQATTGGGGASARSVGLDNHRFGHQWQFGRDQRRRPRQLRRHRRGFQ